MPRAAPKGEPLPVAVVNNKFSLERRRLTLARELAHRVIDTDTHVLSDKDEEKAANRFAGAFLMPAKHLLDEVGKHRNALDYKEVIGLKRLYRISGAALLMRVRQLDVITIGRNDRSRSPKYAAVTRNGQWGQWGQVLHSRIRR